MQKGKGNDSAEKGEDKLTPKRGARHLAGGLVERQNPRVLSRDKTEELGKLKKRTQSRKPKLEETHSRSANGRGKNEQRKQHSEGIARGA